MAAILAHREVAPLLSDDHFSVDGTLIKVWASMKSFQPKAENIPPDDDPGSPPQLDTAAEDQLFRPSGICTGYAANVDVLAGVFMCSA